MKHMYAIPTHRPMPRENVEDYFGEVDYANKEFNEECILVFFEDTEEYVNLATINDVSKLFPAVKYMYINRKDTVFIYDNIIQNLTPNAKSIFKKMYPNENVNYGNIFNRIFIFSILLNIDYIHRRDSDVLFEDNKGKKIYPIFNEMKYLSTMDNNKKVFVCGGGYKGKYDLDIESLVRDDGKDYSLVRKLFSCMSIPEEHHDDIIEEEILNNNIPFNKDLIDFDSKAYPECGNISIYKLHRFFPSPCQDFILGSDYFFIDVAVHAKLDVIYHNRAVIHKHTNDRKKEFFKVYNYWEGFLMLIDSQIFYRKFYETYLDTMDYNNFENDNYFMKELVIKMREEYESFKLNELNERKTKYFNTLAILKEADDLQIVDIANKLPNVIEEIISITNHSIEDHIKLIENWSEIVGTTEMISLKKEIQDFMLDKIMEG